jgi:hypothetical protein
MRLSIRLLWVGVLLAGLGCGDASSVPDPSGQDTSANAGAGAGKMGRPMTSLKAPTPPAPPQGWEKSRR